MGVQIGGDVQELVVVTDEWQSRVHYVTIPAGGALQPLWTRRCRLVGWSLCEATGSAGAKFQIIDGTAISDPAPVTVGLASGASSFGWVGHPGPRFDGGMSFSPVSGSMSGAVWIEDLGQ